MARRVRRSWSRSSASTVATTDGTPGDCAPVALTPAPVGWLLGRRREEGREGRRGMLREKCR